MRNLIGNRFNKLIFIIVFALILNLSTNSQVFYVSPLGSDTNPGTLAQPWATLQKAASTLTAGQTAYFRTGTYLGYVSFNNSGTSANPIAFKAYPGEAPVIDGGNVASNPSNPWSVPYLIRLYGNYIVFSGIECKNAAAVSIYCGQGTINNLIDSVHVHNGYLGGILLYMCNTHTVSSCKVHDLYDYGVGGTGGGGNADGIQASAGNTLPNPNYGQHVIRNNVVYNTSDDGIDTWTSNGNLIVNNEVHNTGYGNPSNGGSLASTWNQPAGNGNGFKLGGQGISGSNIVINNISYSNLVSGFDGNSGVANKYYNNTAYNNPAGYIQLENNVVIKNNISFSNTINTQGTPGTTQNNTWDLGITNPNFISVIPSSINFLHLSATGSAIDVGQNLSAQGVLTDKNGTSRPQGAGYDLGAYESMSTTSTLNYFLSDQNILVYPNPFNNIFWVNANDLNEKIISLYNAIGELILSKTTTGRVCEVDLRDYTSGIYFIVVNTKNKLSSVKIIKQ